MKRRDLSGLRVGRLTVVAPAADVGKRTRWLCRCDCGKERVVYTSNLTRSHTMSCGCYHADMARENSTGVDRRGTPNDVRFVSDTVAAIAVADRRNGAAREVLLDSADLHLLSGHRWYVVGGYAATNYPQRVYLHNLIMREAIMAAPEGYEVDHISRDKLDNRRSNLRVGTKAANKANRILPRGRSGYIGVCQYRRTDRWYAQARVKGVLTHLGFFSSPEEAAHVRDAAVTKEYGEFAMLNFPEEVDGGQRV